MREAGLSLLEVLVALTVVALVLGAAVSVVGSGAANHGHLRERTEAQWVALNALTQARLRLIDIGVPVVKGAETMGRTEYHWRLRHASAPGMSSPPDTSWLQLIVEVSPSAEFSEVVYRASALHRQDG